MEKRINATLLLSFYGPLLTERQRQILRYYFEEDLSLSEIAELLGLTRQAVHDAIQRGVEQLERWEEKLQLRVRWVRMCEQLAACQAYLRSGNINQAAETLHLLLEEEQAGVDDEGGIAWRLKG